MNRRVTTILGSDVRVKRKEDLEISMENLDSFFTNPIIHRQIHGDKVYVPLNMSRIWPNCEK
ncbi:hypothetical protein [Neobacillus mesonae]|uniref:hypothetical protein n=1 Tax=Neobacillus mesonae TaxID=1193713 RepID=UPI002E1E9AAF|nr:hypothetical protein [Neobacillus mesonae]